MPELSAFSVEIEQEKVQKQREIVEGNGGLFFKSHDFRIKIKLFALQNIGIIFGFGTMFLMALYGSLIEDLLN